MNNHKNCNSQIYQYNKYNLSINKNLPNINQSITTELKKNLSQNKIKTRNYYDNFQKISLHKKLGSSIEKLKQTFLTDVYNNNNITKKEEEKSNKIPNEKIIRIIKSKNNNKNSNSIHKYSNIQYELINQFSNIPSRNIRLFNDNIKSMSKTKYFMKVQKSYVNEKEKILLYNNYLLTNNEYNLRRKNKNLINETLPKYESYNKFLGKSITKNNEINYELQNKISNLKTEMKKINSKINNLKKLKEQYINIRNFLIMVKENILILPYDFIESSYEYDNNLNNNEDNLNKINKEITNSPKKNKPKNKFVRRKSSLLRLNSIQNIKNRKSLNKENKNIKKISNLDKYLTKNIEVLFSSPDDFLKTLKNLEYKNLKLLENYNILNESIFILKNELNELYEENNNLNNYDNSNEVKETENLLKEIKERNLILNKNLNYCKNIINNIEEKNLDLNYLIKINRNEIDNNIYLLRYLNFKNKKNYYNDFLYIYYYLSILFKTLYNLYKKQNFFNYGSINKNKIINPIEYINILSNPDKYNETLLKNVTKDVLFILENAINYLINNLNNLKLSFRSNKYTIKNIENKIIFNRRKENTIKLKILYNNIKNEQMLNLFEKKEIKQYKLKWNSIGLKTDNKFYIIKNIRKKSLNISRNNSLYNKENNKNNNIFLLSN